MENLTPAEQYGFAFQNTEPKYYSIVPHIIDDLSYIENGEVKRLSVYAKELYRVIRRFASNEVNVCWASTKTLAEFMNCSVGAVCNAKKELMKPMTQLDGNALITETRKSKSSYKDGKISGKQIYCSYIVNDIWRWNNAYMATYKFQKEFKANSLNESSKATNSLNEFASPEASSCGEPNNNPYLNKNPLFKEQQPTAEADPVVFLKKEKVLFPSAPSSRRAYEWLISQGCDKRAAMSLAKKYSAEDIGLASKYCGKASRNKINKDGKIENRWGYLTSCLQQRWWEKKDV